MYSTLYNKHNYLLDDQKFLLSNYIREYDLSKANISVLYASKVIDEDTYNRLLVSDKMDREIEIGKMIRKDSSIQDTLSKGIIEAKKLLFEANQIQDNEVLSIKNDAVFIIGRPLYNTVFLNGLLTFNNKNNYNSYYRLGTYEYYGYNINDAYDIDIKGIGSKRSLHEKYMIDFFKYCFLFLTLKSLKKIYCFYMAEQVNIREILDLVKGFYTDYVCLKLANGYYRPLNSERYLLRNMLQYCPPQEVDEVREEDKKYIDISYNLNILRELHQCYSTVYFNKRR